MTLHFARAVCAAALAGALGTAIASPNGVVISQVYGGGGNSGATLKNDFIEIFNAGSAPVTLTGWSVQYASAAGTSWQVTPLGNVALLPGQYYLVQEAIGAGGTANLPTPDATGTIPMAAGAGKVALVSSITALSGPSPISSSLVDLIGFGTANGFEQTVAPTPGNPTALLRAESGCTDSDNNGSDFSVGTPTPRNTSSPTHACNATGGGQPIVTTCPALTVALGGAAKGVASATDVDGTVNTVRVVGSLPPALRIAAFSAATGAGGVARQQFEVAPSAQATSYGVTLEWANDQGQTALCTQVVNVAPITPIYTIQGSSATSPKVNQAVLTQGIVTKVNNNGFFLQDPVGDGDPATSDGIFVFTVTAPTVAAGQRVQVSATVSEFNTGAATNADTLAHTVTELTGISAIKLTGVGYAVAPVAITLPFPSRDDMERHEGMLVTVNGPLTVGQNFFQGRYGQVSLAALGRLETPTNRLRPGPGAQALNDENLRRSILLDDGTSLQNPNPTPYIGDAGTLRAGDTVASITGVIDYGLTTASNADAGSYKLHPVTAPVFTRSNPRTTTPEEVGGTLRVGSMNVLNFFTTFLDGRTADGASGQGCTLGGATTTASNCRGANDALEFTRQRAKIVEAIVGLNADALGLMEMQNNGATAVQNLVDAVNARLGAPVYAAVADPAQGTGSDAIKVAMIYKPARVTLAGAAVSDPDTINNRPPLAQTFIVPSGERFTLIVNHLKSKGCDTSSAPADFDNGDLQGCFNARRLSQAQRLKQFVAQLQASQGTPDVVLVGDFNSYAQEDPIADLIGSGFVDQIGRFNTFGYSYVFDGTAGRLDHAITTPSLSPRVTRAVEWHINADEPSVIDYNTEFKQPSCAICAPDLYTATPYRASDHDPVLIGLSFGSATAARGTGSARR